LKAFWSLSNYFGDACICGAKSKELGLAALKQLLILDAPQMQASVSQNSRISLSKTFQPYQFDLLQFFMGQDTKCSFKIHFDVIPEY
jgi:hypothetical protein